jgi:hypothetical protein
MAQEVQSHFLNNALTMGGGVSLGAGKAQGPVTQQSFSANGSREREKEEASIGAARSQNKEFAWWEYSITGTPFFPLSVCGEIQ